MRFNDSIDEKNAELLNELESAGIQIEFEIRKDLQHWGVQPRYKFAIAAPDENSSPEMLAHELLHIKLNVLGFLPTSIIMDFYYPGNCHFDTKQISNLQNQLAHIKMLPLFVELGYPADKFTINHGNDFFLKDLIPSTIKLRAMFGLFKKGGLRPSIDLVTEFIINIVCIKQYEVEHSLTGKKVIDTESLISELKAADEPLFNAIYEELTKWTDVKTYRNSFLYQNLNFRLYQLGYPVESDWSSWAAKETETTE
jgi:hypothetical protein